MSVALSILGTLATIAVSYGLERAAKAISEKRAAKKGVTSAYLDNLVDKILAEAKTKGASVEDKIVNALSNLPYGNGSSTVLNKIRSERARLNALQDDVAALKSKAVNDENIARSGATSFSLLDDNSRAKVNKSGSMANIVANTATQAAERARNSYNQLENIERKI